MPFSGQEFVIVLLVLALIFGASRLPTLARNFGLGIKEFRKGIKDAGADDSDGGEGGEGDGEPASGGASGSGASGSKPSSNGTGASDDVPAKRRD